MVKKKTTVLIVDDNKTVRLMLDKILKKMDMNTLLAENGAEAVDIFSEQLPDCILMDINMPVMNGYEACREIRKKERGEFTPIMVVTVQDDLDSINKAFDAGATDFATKPINAAIIGYRIQYMLRNSQYFLDLQYHKSQLDNAQELALMGHWEANIDGTDFSGSSELYRIFETDPEESKSFDELLISRVYDEDKKFVKNIRQEGKKKKEPYALDYRITDGLGKTKYLHELTDVTHNKVGKVSGMFGYVQDITQLKETELELIKLNKELEQRVLERTAELREANKDLSETLEELKRTQEALVESKKMAALAQLIAGLAHEINTPLGISIAVSSNIEAEIRKLNQLCEDHKKYKDIGKKMDDIDHGLKILSMNLKRTGELIKTFKMVSVDNITAEPKKINLKDYLNEIMLSLSPEIKRNHVETIYECDSIEKTIIPGTLYQVITILVINSLRHAFPPEYKGEKMITLLGHREQDKVILEYSDNGVGIAEKHIKKIFDPFFTIGSKSESVGLGLHIAFNLVTQTLRGTITCESMVGKGTKFIVTF